ncbi:MAG: hypothetical protein IPM57_11460 [Oligoflexia bacterium]|nr:hypothetical protein [Oligoflexia bacterium]
MKTAIMMGIVLLFAALWATAGDLDKEINAFQVDLISEKAYKAQLKKAKKLKPLKLKKQALAKKTKPQKISKKSKPSKIQPEVIQTTSRVVEPYNDDIQISDIQPTMSYTARPEIENKSSGLFIKATALPQFMFSAFDGADDSHVSPRGLGDSMKNGFAGNVTMDLNLFNNSNFVLEAGVSYLNLGAKTGIKQDPNALNSFYYQSYNPYNLNTNNSNITYEDDVKSQYIGVIAAIKWYASGFYTSGFYARGGILPMFLMNKQISQGAGYYPYTPYYTNQQLAQNNDSRFGGINSFDLAAQLGVGYSLKLSSDFSVIADITGTQGFLPVMGNYNVYNAALAAGLGISYSL